MATNTKRRRRKKKKNNTLKAVLIVITIVAAALLIGLIYIIMNWRTIVKKAEELLPSSFSYPTDYEEYVLKYSKQYNVDPVFVNVNVTLFDSGGISESNSNLLQKERSKTLKELIQPKILADYDRYADDIRMMQRIRRHKGAFKLVNIIERVLFKMEKRQFKRRGIK